LILMIGFFTNKSPLVLLTGVGATSAFFLFIFKDIILGIVASIQITVTNSVRIGDRISIENKNIDGNIVEIAISTVKIKNTDNTITTIPTYNLISEVVKNWRFMTEAGAKRIKRTINIDINSIKPCSAELLQLLRNYKTINDYLLNYKDGEIINLTLYRVYLMDFLKNHPNINQDQVSVIRHLDSGKNGLPLEIYTYTTNLSFEGYEKIQAEIFEYCFSALSKFELKVLQS
ncbi:MAG: mechanosensitive ion channel, partial [Burkholderiales bacterium]|nr:mechanosensitive ion channel [Burkholderiales bacterium]